MRKTLMLATALLLMAGCANTQKVWVKPGATQADFARDSYDCEKDTRQSGYFGTGFVGAMNMQEFASKCMVAHGWSLQTSPSSVRTPDGYVSCEYLEGMTKITTTVTPAECRSRGGTPAQAS